MRRLSYLTTLFFLILFAISFNSLGQGKFSDSKKNIWIKGLSASDEQNGKLNYNFPIRFSEDLSVLNKKNEVSKFTYVFYVLKSEELEKRVFSLFHNGNLHTFYTDRIKSNTEVPIPPGVLKDGSIINFNFFNKDFKKKEKGILYLDNNLVSELYEVIVCNTCGDIQDRYAIQTYLAIKYGITLGKKDLYLGSDKRKVWDEKLDENFNNTIFGMARDDYFGLKQLASYSNVDSTLVAKSTNAATWSNHSYILFGNDKGEKVFDENSGVYKRRWLMQNKGDSDVSFDFNLAITPDLDTDYLLFLSNGETFYHDTTDSIQLSFKNLELKSNENSYLTLMAKKPFNLMFKESQNNFNKKYTLQFSENGTPPFTITAQGENIANNHTFVSNDHFMILGDLPKSTYSFSVVDADGQEATLKGKFIDANKRLLALESNWLLEHGKKIEIKPTISEELKKAKLTYAWYQNEKLLSEQPNLMVYQEGSFTLKVKSEEGTVEVFPFAVTSLAPSESKVSDSGWVVSPNPVNRGEDFRVTYTLDFDKSVDFYIYTLEGKFILRDQLGVLKNGSYTYSLEGASNYVLVAIINGKASMQTLIVK